MTATGPRAEGVLTVASRFTVAETLAKLNEAFEQHDLTVFAHFDHGGAAREAGLQMQPGHVLVFGNPRAGTPVMVAAPLAALDLPLKALIWQDEAGDVWVSFNSSDFLRQRYGIPANLVPNIARAENLIRAAVGS
jgi:uncharacterized protein (DUF302 family)